MDSSDDSEEEVEMDYATMTSTSMTSLGGLTSATSKSRHDIVMKNEVCDCAGVYVCKSLNVAQPLVRK